MSKFFLIGATILTIVMFGIGYVVEFLNSFIAAFFDLPGPYSDSPFVWVWFSVNLTIVFIASFYFCKWFARRIERNSGIKRVFE